MMIEPPIDKLVGKVGNPYKLALIVGKRARFLNETLTTEQKEEKHEVTRAIDEVYAGDIIVDNDIDA